MAEQSQGTEYTLQGVMRFLQIEWHNHERARNAWDIEKAEMKAKIAKQEGDCRAMKRLNELLDKQVRMLEKALKHERAKNKAIAAGEEPPKEEDLKKEWGGKIGVKENTRLDSMLKAIPSSNSETQLSEEQERQAQQDHAKTFLSKCVEELTYLLTPPSHPPPPHPEQSAMSQHLEYALGQDVPMSNADIRYQQQLHQSQSAQHQKRMSNSNASHLPSLPNHHPAQTRGSADYYDPSRSGQSNSYQPAMMARMPSGQPPLPQAPPQAALEEIQQPMRSAINRPVEEEVEQVTHSFDSYGRQVPNNEFPDHSRRMVDDKDQWNFDEQNTLLEPPPADAPPPAPRPENDAFPQPNHASKSPSRHAVGSRRRKSSGANGISRRMSDGAHEVRDAAHKGEPQNFKVRFALRGHLDVVRSVIFTGGGSPSEPEICTAGDDGMIKRWIIPASYGNPGASHSLPDLDIQSYFTHRGHDGIVTSLAACPASPSFSTGGRAVGDGWIFSGGQDATVRVWERGRVDQKAILDGHTDAIWSLCVLPASASTISDLQPSSSRASQLNPAAAGNPGSSSSNDRILIASGSADCTIKIWAVSAPPQLSSPSHAGTTSRRGVGGSRRHSVTSGSGFPSSPQPSTASVTPFHYTLLHSIQIDPTASPTCISPFGATGENFVVSYSNSSIIIFDTRTGDRVAEMASGETYDGTPATGVNSVVVTSTRAGGVDAATAEGRVITEEEGVHGATGNAKQGGVEGVVISGHEDRYVRFFDANSGQCTYNMLAHPAAISSLSLSPDGRELVSAGHDASIRFWSLEKRSCVQEVTSHRPMRGEGVVCVVWSQDGRWVVGAGGDGVVKVFAR